MATAVKYLIEDNYYLIPEDLGWAIAKWDGDYRKDGVENVKWMGYFPSAKKALTWYYADRCRRKAIEYYADRGRSTATEAHIATVEELLEHLIAEERTVQCRLLSLLHKVEVEIGYEAEGH